MSQQTSPDSPGELLRAFEYRAKKRFGQHFLVDPRILNQIADAAAVGPEDRVVEIGPGCGTLTLALLQRGATVQAFEIDRDAIAFLNDVLVPHWPLSIVEGDVLRQDLGEHLQGRGWKAVANLPYNVGTEIYFRLMDIAERFECLVLMFQREVARRFVARPGERDYGVLSLMCQLYTNAEIVMTLPPGAFVPPPKVHSAVVRFTPVPGTRIQDDAVRKRFVSLVKAAFSTRRKTLPNALKSLGLDKAAVAAELEELGFDPRVRPEEVDFETYEELSRRL